MSRPRHGCRTATMTVAFAVAAGCASAPVRPAPVMVVVPVVVSLDQKVSWIVRLEQQRSLRDGSAGTVDATAPTTAGFTAATAPDLSALARDPDVVVRRRAILAIGRVGSHDGLPALLTALQDPDPDARASAAFALGLIGASDPTDSTLGATPVVSDFPGATALEAALNDPSVLVRGRAIEALGLIGRKSAASAIARNAAGCAAPLAAIEPDDEEWPKAVEIEMCRLALFALVRLQDYEALAAVALDPQGRPVSRWWPVAFALQRIGDPRAGPALLSLASGPGTYTVGFALRGLAALKDPAVTPVAAALATRSNADLKVRIAAVRALGQIGQAGPLRNLLATPALPPNLIVEVVTALGTAADPAGFDAILDFMTHPSPAVRAAALAAAAKINRDGFLVVLSGLGRDADWSVRASLTGVLATLPAERVTAAIEELIEDDDVRVRGPALEALAAVKAPTLTGRLFTALEAPDFVVRATAARLIGDARPEGGVPRLVAAYARGESDATYSARWAALEALSKYGQAQPASPRGVVGAPAVGTPVEVLTTLQRALADREWPVRWRAARVLARLGVPEASPVRPAPLNRPETFFDSPQLLHPPYSPHAFILTRYGAIEVQLNVVEAAVTVQAFIDQVRAGFFNGMKIHRLVPTFVVQAGDPRGDGEGGPGYTLRDELSPTPYLRGTVGMALDWRDTGGSQWFIALSPQPHLDGRYTAFGRVIGGWDVLDQLAQWDVIERIRIWDGVTLQ